ncbi:MAG: helix-turn-helix domain-containing protein [Actinobacteria bacterium]|nr:helix-turn-helix domain-containing protein [Actinomycetota bacterium]
MPADRTGLGFAPTGQSPVALFARVPAASAAKLNSAAAALGRPKQEVVAALLDRYLDVLGEEWPAASTQPSSSLEVLTSAQLAEFLQVGERTVRELAGRGELPGRMVGREWRFARRAVLDWLAG